MQDPYFRVRQILNVDPNPETKKNVHDRGIYIRWKTQNTFRTSEGKRVFFEYGL